MPASEKLPREAKRLYRRGQAHLSESPPRLPEVIRCWEQAAEICGQAGARTNQASLLNNIGEVYRLQGDLDRAMEYYGRALAIDETISAHPGETAVHLSNMGLVYQAQGNLERALESFQQALALMESVAPRSSEIATILNNIGLVYQALGDLGRALEYLQRALAIDETMAPQSAKTATALNNIGTIFLSLEDPDRALEYFRRAFAIDAAVAYKSCEFARDLNSIGSACFSKGELTQALGWHQEALTILKKNAPESGETANSLNHIGKVHFTRGDFGQALVYFQQALAINEAIASRSSQTAGNLFNIGCVYYEQKDLVRALEMLERSIQIVESLRQRASTGQRGKERLFAKHIDLYEATIKILGLLDEPEQAFGYAERSRARGMAELLAERAIDATAHAPAELLAEERRLKHRRARSYNDLLEARNEPQRDEQKIAQLDAQQDELEREFEALEARIRRNCPEYADLQYPRPLALDDVQQYVLGPDDVLLEYFVGEANTYLWAVQKEKGRFEFRVLDLTSQELDEKVRGEFRRRLDESVLRYAEDWRERQITAARWLYEKLILPVERFIRNAKRILLCVDGPLHFLPFEALVCGERPANNGNPFHRCVFLGERYVCTYVPSVTVLKNLRDALARRQRPADNDLISFGDPDFDADSESTDEHRGLRLERIPATGTEVRRIFEEFTSQQDPHELAADAKVTVHRSRAVGVVAVDSSTKDDSGPSILSAQKTRAYLREEASKRRAVTESADYRYIHFATHGLLDDEYPLNSGVAFSSTAAASDSEGSWLLQTHEIFSLKLNADLVTLSACQTGLGKLVKGEGLVSMIRAFLFAGTASLLVSLWSVDDEATAVLMVDFYRRIRAGRDKAMALIETKREMMKHPEYRDPFYWAPFVLHGE